MGESGKEAEKRMSIKSSGAKKESQPRKELIVKIGAWVAVVSGVVGLAVTARQFIGEHNSVPLQQYYATLSDDCLNDFFKTGLIDGPGGAQIPAEYVRSIGFGDVVRTSIREISQGKPRTIDEATFLVLKNVSPEEAKEVNFFGQDIVGSETHFMSGSVMAICVRYASTTGEKKKIEPTAYEFVPEQGSRKRITIESYDENKTRQASASKSCSMLGYPPKKD
jgi:hypothetical protein